MNRTHRQYCGIVALTLSLSACGGRSIGHAAGGPASSGAAESGAGTQSPGSDSGGVGVSGGSAASGSASQGAGAQSGAGASGGSPAVSGSGSASSPDGSALGSTDGGPVTPEGGTRSPRGCGLGTSCIPGNDLAPPDPADGYQIVTPPGQFTLQPGQEIFPNYCQTLPNTAEFDVGTVRSWMTPGSSHDLYVYAGQGAGTGSPPGCNPQGGGGWIFAASIPGTIVELKMPDGVGEVLPAGALVVLSAHFVNLGTSVEEPQIKLNLLRARNFQYAAGAMISFNVQINIPAATASGPGMQSVRGTCTPPAGANFFALGMHTYRHATAADVDFVSGGQATNVVHSTDWLNPDVAVWGASPFLTAQSGDSFAYSCTYANTGTTAVTVGETEGSNEICMTVGYYFPAGNAICR